MCNIAIFSTEDEKIIRSILSVRKNREKVKLIITNIPDSPVVEVAKRYNIQYKCFDHRDYEDRVSHEKDIVRFLKSENIDWIVFAHYMRLITKYFVDRFRNRIINVHPSLLPDFKGANGYRDAFHAGVKKSGCTIHYVDEGLDTGKVLLQKEVPRLEKDDFHSFKSRVHDIECNTIQMFVESLVV